MISKKHSTVFVHVPKVAGQSIEQMFLNDLGLDWESRSDLLLRKKEPEERGPERLAHLVAKDYVELGFMNSEDFKSYFKFSFVRNPYKRTFSFYNFLGYSRIISFRTFVNTVLPMKLDRKDFFFLSQYDYLHNAEGELLVDFLGRLETIKDDIEIVKKRIGMEQTLPHANKSKGEWKRVLGLLYREPVLIGKVSFGHKGMPYDKALTDDIKEQIFELYKEDFEAFGYAK